VTADPKWWPTGSPPDELVEAAFEFCRLLRRAGWEPTGELVEWVAHREFERVIWDTALRP
jgi:hypothetical protein